MYNRTIHPSPDLPTARDRFLADIAAWVRDCLDRYADAPATNVHDQATFTTGWEPYIRLTVDAEALAFMRGQRDRIRDHFTATGQWRHGYWRMHEAHHGTEHFELSLGTLHRLDPDDDSTTSQLVDAAEHIGNWVADVPPWFDWETGLFRSTFLGTDGVKVEPGLTLNLPDHFRCVNICLLAHGATGEQRYLDLATAHAGCWAEAILAEETLPLALDKSGPIYQFSTEAEASYRSYMGQAPALHDDVDRAENFLASGATNALLTLWQQTGDGRFRRATERLLNALVTQVGDPDAGAAADAIRSYRRATVDTRYDDALGEAIAAVPPAQSLGLDLPPPLAQRPSGVGKRSDLPRWMEDGAPRQVNPITLAVAAEILGDDALATHALDLARGYFALARQALPDGRDHGCAARTVSAVARGHGRDNHAGVITAVLGPLGEGFRPNDERREIWTSAAAEQD